MRAQAYVKPFFRLITIAGTGSILSDYYLYFRISICQMWESSRQQIGPHDEIYKYVYRDIPYLTSKNKTKQNCHYVNIQMCFRDILDLKTQ